MNPMRPLRSLLYTSFALGACATSNGWAQDVERENVLEEIVVTAERREGSVQTTAASITALSGDNLVERGLSDLQSLSTAVPNVNVGELFGQARIAIRGVGFEASNPTFEARVAYHLDGVYISRPAAAAAAFFDVERVEVLRGPQGTLYGRNATGGAVNVISRKPTDALSGYLDLTLGNYSLLETQGALSGSLSDTVSARVAFRTRDRDGYGENIVTGSDIDDAQARSVRASVHWQPGDVFDMTLTADHHVEDDHAYGVHYFGPGSPTLVPRGLALGGIAAANLRDVANERDPANDREFSGSTLRARWDLGDITLSSLTSYRLSEYTTATDVDGTSYELSRYIQNEESTQRTQEFQLQGEHDNSRWTLGAFLFDEKIDGSVTFGLNSIILGGADQLRQGYLIKGNLQTKSAALFGEYTQDIGERLSLTLGARYSRDEKEIDDLYQLDFVRPYSPSNPPIPSRPPRSADDAFDSFTPKFTIDYNFTVDTFGYLTVAKGFKSGGFNLGDNSPAYEPEEIWNYETGIKSTVLDGRLRNNVSVFYYDYKNLQVNKVETTVVVIENAAESMVYGAEWELYVLPTDSLSLDLAVSWLHSEYDDYMTADPARLALGVLDLSGNQLPQSPELTVNFGAEYVWTLQAGDLKVRGEYRWVDDVYFTAFNTATAYQEANDTANAFVSFDHAGGHWGASAFVRNLTDETVIATSTPGTTLVGAPAVGTLMPPRTYGVRLTYKF
jgi:iron complex outermembrane recepter protein